MVLSWWRAWLKRKRRGGCRSGRVPKAGFRPQLEPLEARYTPATLTVGTNVNMSHLLGNQSEASLAINPTNPNYLVAFSNDNAVASGILVYTSSNGGASWSSRVIANGDGLGVNGCCDTEAAYDSFGNLFAAYLDEVNGIEDVKVLLSTDNGSSFRLLATLASNADQPAIAAAAGSVWVSYTDSAGTMSARGAAVTGLGAVGAFKAAEVVPGSSGGDFGNIAIGPSGQVLITYQNPSGTRGPSKIFVNLDDDGLGAHGFGPATFVTSTNVGGFYAIPPQPKRTVDAEANLVYDRSGGAHNGRVYLVYTDAPANQHNNTDIFVRFSDDNGTTWSSRVRVNDDTGTNSQFMPMIAIDQSTGNLAVAWYDARNAGSKDKTTQIYATASIDGGATFLPNVRVSAGTSNANQSGDPNQYGDFYTMDFVNGAFYPIWADNSNSTSDNPNGALRALDIYTAKVVLSTASATTSVLEAAAIVSTPGKHKKG